VSKIVGHYDASRFTECACQGSSPRNQVRRRTMKGTGQRILGAKARYNVALLPSLGMGFLISNLVVQRAVQCPRIIPGCESLSLSLSLSLSHSSDRSSIFPTPSPPFQSWISRLRAWYSASTGPCLKGSRLQQLTDVWRRIQEGVHFSGRRPLLKRLSQQDACMRQISCQQTSRRLKGPQIRHPQCPIQHDC